MGTNYYWRDRICPACDRYDEIHVGKKSIGWAFSFQGFRNVPYDPADESYGWREKSPLDGEVISRADWRDVFATRPGELRDEYGVVVADPVAWIEEWPPPTSAERRREDEAYRPGWAALGGREWRDPEGFRFSAGEFS